MDLKSYLDERVALVDKALDSYLPAEDTLPASLHKAMRYSVFAGGKRLRPILTIASCEAVGGRAEMALPAACAMEMIHTYSLIHDDLPAMDDDDLRRGRPTNHKVFGEASAILAGDALLTEAFILLSNPESQKGLSPEVCRRVIHTIGRCAGSLGMVGGQVVDMESEGKEYDLPTLEYIHTHKTGALLLASVQAGALIGGADEASLSALSRYAEAAGLAFQVADDILDVTGEQDRIGKEYDLPTLEYIHTHKTGALLLASVQAGALIGGADEPSLSALSRYAEAAGLAFQVADDILDVTGEQDRIGKDVGSDEARGKATYPALLGLAEARNRARDLRDLACSALDPLGEGAEPLRRIAHYIVDRSS